MFLKEMKIKTFSLIEEYYPEVTGMAEDEDVLNKINGVINQIQLDLMKYRKINASEKIIVGEEDSKTINFKEEFPDLYQLKTIEFKNLVEYKMPNEETIVLPDDFVGEFDIYYFKYPKLIKVLFEGETEEKNPYANQNDGLAIDFEHLHIRHWGELMKMLEKL